MSVADFTRSIEAAADQPAALRSRITDVLTRIADASRAAGRRPEDVTLVAVSKTVDRRAVDAALALGIRHFGENRVQDASRKLGDPLPAGACLHLIGQLQSNKAKPAAALFDIIESVDRPSVIDALEKAAERNGQPLPVLLQVNVAREPQKAGCDPDQAASLMARLAQSPSLTPQGLMTMAPLVADPEDARPIFAGLRTIQHKLQRQFPAADLHTLSMGMTNDFHIAIEEGATSVRIGRAIFGP